MSEYIKTGQEVKTLFYLNKYWLNILVYTFANYDFLNTKYKATLKMIINILFLAINIF